MAEKLIRVGWQIDNSDLVLSQKLFDKTAQSIGVAEEETKQLNKQFEKYNQEGKGQLGIIEKLRAEEEKLRKARDKATDPKELAKYNKELEKTQGKIRNLEKSGTSSFKSLKAVISDVGKVMTAAFAVDRIAGFFSTTVGAASNFEASMSRVAALTGATGEEFDKLNDLAKDLGSTTQFSATESAEAITFLAQAGFNTNEILKALPGTLDLAAAGQLDLASAADIASNVLSAYGLEAGEINRVNDILAFTANKANTNVTQFAEAFKVVGPVARGSKIDIEETSAAIGILANSGVQGSLAGTGLRGVIASLEKPTREAAGALQKLGVQVRTNSGELRPLSEIFADLNKVGANTNDFFTIFGRNAGSTAQILAASSDDFAQFTTDISNIEEGFAKTIAAQQLDNFKGSLTALSSAFEGFAISIGEVLLPVLRVGVDFLSLVFQGLTKLPAIIRDNAAVVAALTGSILLLNSARINEILFTEKGILAKVKDRVVTLAKAAADRVSAVATTASTVATGAYNTAVGLLTGKVKLATIAQKAFNLVTKANPAAILITGVTALATAYFALSKRVKQVSASELIRSEIQNKLAEELAKVRVESDRLFNTIQNENASQKERAAAINEVNSEYKRFLPNLLTENSSLKEIEAARKLVNDGLRNEILLKLKAAKINSLQTADLQRQFGLLGGISQETGIAAEKLVQFAGEGQEGLAKFRKELEDSGAAAALNQKTFESFSETGLSGLSNNLEETVFQFKLYQKTASATNELIKTTEAVTNDLLGTTKELEAQDPQDVIPAPTQEQIKAFEQAQKEAEALNKEVSKLRAQAELEALGGESTEAGLQLVRDREMAQLEASKAFQELRRQDEQLANVLLQKIEQEHQDKIQKLRDEAASKEKARNKQILDEQLSALESEFEQIQLIRDQQLLAELEDNRAKFEALAENDIEGRRELEERRQELEEEFELQRTEDELLRLENEKALLMANGEETLAIEQEILNKRLDLIRKHTEDRVDLKNKEKEAEIDGLRVAQSIGDEVIGLGRDILDGRREQAKENSKTQKAIFEADKAFTLVQNSLKFQEELAKISATYAANPILLALFGALATARFGVRQFNILQTEYKPPAFAKGVIDLPGPGTGTSDSINAKLSRGESVMTAKETKSFKPTLLAIRNNWVEPDLLNDFVQNQGRGSTVVNVNQDQVVEAIQGLPVSKFSFDQYGFTESVTDQQNRTESLNKKYSL